MIDTPDLRTLAAEALYAAPDEECGTWHGIVRVVLAAVLPEHRRQVLGEAERVLRHCADSVPWSDPTLRRGIQYAAATVVMLTRDPALDVLPDFAAPDGPRRQVLAEAADAIGTLLDRYHQDLTLDTPADTAAYRAGRQAINDAAAIVRRLASAAPETAPRPRQDDETAPAVGREAAQAQRAAEGGGWVPLAEVLDALWDRARELRQLFRTGEYGIEYVNGWEAAHDFIDARFAAPQGADEGNDRG